MERPTAHFCEEYLLNPIHPITVDLVGCGGNGSMMASCLARIDTSLRRLGHPGLQATLHDDDRVEETNVGRQLFTDRDIGLNKAVALATRINRCHGTAWEARAERYEPDPKTNLIITCTDNVASRKAVSRMWNGKAGQRTLGYDREHRNHYWLDLGNAQRTGQAVLGSQDILQPKVEGVETVGRLPTVDELFGLREEDEALSGPSCSLAEALRKQDLFVNSLLAQAAGAMLWQLLRDGSIGYHGIFANLETMTMRPLKVRAENNR